MTDFHHLFAFVPLFSPIICIFFHHPLPFLLLCYICLHLLLSFSLLLLFPNHQASTLLSLSIPLTFPYFHISCDQDWLIAIENLTISLNMNAPVPIQIVFVIITMI